MSEEYTNINKKFFKVAVVGPIPRDTITTYEGKTIKRYGCLTHTAISLAKLLGDNGVVYPVSHIRKIDEAPIKKLFSEYKNIDTSYIDSSADKGDVIQLKFIDKNKRIEKQTGVMNPITPHDVKYLLDCDTFVFVPVTDFEIELDTLKFIKKYSNATVIFDAHGPTNTLAFHGERVYKAWISSELWFPYIDILKMNLEEAECTWYKSEYTMEELENNVHSKIGKRRDYLPEMAKYILKNTNIKYLCVTVDMDGCMVYQSYLNNNESDILAINVPSIYQENIVDTTGCGDSFAGGLAYGYLLNNNIVEACKYANALGALRTQGRGFDVFKNAKDTKSFIDNYYSKFGVK